MGAGIAAACIVSGVPVVLVEPDAKQRERAQTRVKAALSYKRSLSEHQRSEYLKNISICDNIEDLKSCSFLIEAVYEDFDVKREVLGRLAAIVDQDCIIATNTSSLPIRILAEGLDSADRVIGMHFFNPAERMPLVEIVVGRESSNRSIALTAALCSMLGKYPVVVQDVPGFLVNRVLSPYFLETGFLLGDGASPDQIDKQALAFGMPMGPVRLLDEVGLDIAAKVASVMHESYGPRMEGPLFAAQLTEQGRLGRKNGKGFYRFDGDDWYPDSEVEKMLGLSFDSSKNSAEDIQDRLFLSMVNEAVRCLDEAVAGESGSEAAGQIDLASVMGTGFAPFRGGLMHYADNLGAPEVMKRMVRLMELHGERFAPAKGIRIRADEKLSFYDAV
jgi:3-hydroxyacyl-CoA dehydrogenase/enoyl-CoA hydratase/3-hydroxybutyryl-CoA epimerase